MTEDHDDGDEDRRDVAIGELEACCLAEELAPREVVLVTEERLEDLRDWQRKIYARAGIDEPPPAARQIARLRAYHALMDRLGREVATRRYLGESATILVDWGAGAGGTGS